MPGIGAVCVWCRRRRIGASRSPSNRHDRRPGTARSETYRVPEAPIPHAGTTSPTQGPVASTARRRQVAVDLVGLASATASVGADGEALPHLDVGTAIGGAKGVYHRPGIGVRARSPPQWTTGCHRVSPRRSAPPQAPGAAPRSVGARRARRSWPRRAGHAQRWQSLRSARRPRARRPTAGAGYALGRSGSALGTDRGWRGSTLARSTGRGRVAATRRRERTAGAGAAAMIAGRVVGLGYEDRNHRPDSPERV